MGENEVFALQLKSREREEVKKKKKKADRHKQSGIFIGLGGHRGHTAHLTFGCVWFFLAS